MTIGLVFFLPPTSPAFVSAIGQGDKVKEGYLTEQTWFIPFLYEEA
jgi:hypothetical protein